MGVRGRVSHQQILTGAWNLEECKNLHSLSFISRAWNAGPDAGGKAVMIHLDIFERSSLDALKGSTTRLAYHWTYYRLHELSRQLLTADSLRTGRLREGSGDWVATDFPLQATRQRST
ncbi:hypothetical protein BDZ89DRAFT_1060651 [Hymenopellis radicata]|nr:hypothetical protein BDZ89DRAFT_1060651 [Hymenopellis radicata]